MSEANVLPAKRRSSRMAEREQREEELKQRQLNASISCFLDTINAQNFTEEIFDLFPSVVPLPLPDVQEAFALPVSWIPVPTPKPYRNISINKYIPPLCRPTTSQDDIPLCSCSPDVGCGDNCHNRQLYMECPMDLCNAILPGDTCCLNTAVQSRSFPAVEVFPSSCGFGLRLLEDIPANTPIIEYCGEVITSSECQRRLLQYSITDNFYFAALENGLILDANVYGSAARFANHSCDPNCELQKWNILGEIRLLLISTRGLTAMTELTYNYQYCDDGLDAMLDIMRQPCYCGAPYCSGTIGGKLDTSTREKWLRKTNTMLQGVTRKYTLDEMIEHLSLVQFHPADHDKVYMTYPCPEFEQLQDHIHKTQHWLVSFEELTSAPLVDADAIERMLLQAPNGVKLVEVPLYEKKLQSYSRATKLMQSSNEIVTWDAFNVIISESAVALPCRIDGINDILMKYKMCADRAASRTNNKAPAANSLWQALQQLSKVYEIDVSGAWFGYWDDLSVGLDKYVNRCQLENLPWNITTNVLLSLQPHYKNIEPDPEYGKIAKIGATPKKEHILYCFCRQPETSSECNTMLICDSCEQWYHPICCNIDRQEVRASNNDLVFYCPLCQCHESVVQHFSVLGPQEWHCNESSSGKTKPMMQSLESLRSDVVASLKFPIHETPVKDLLHLKLELCERWLNTTQHLMVKYNAFQEDLDIKWCDDICAMYVPDSTRDKERSLLHQILVLYFDLRVIHVCPPEVLKLRRCIWQLSVMPILRRLRKEEMENEDMLTLYLLRNVLSAGTSLGCDTSVQWKSLRDAVTSLENILNYIASNTMVELVARLESLEKLWRMYVGYFELSESYEAARLNNAVVSQRQVREHQCGGSNTVICWCKKGEEEEGMICCDRCDIWFHYSCVGLRNSKMIKAVNAADTYLCIHCTELEDKEYKYRWIS